MATAQASGSSVPVSTVPALDLLLLNKTFARMRQSRVRYRLGAKADLPAHNPRCRQGLASPPEALDYLDCSGAVRYLLYQATRGRFILPDGSQNQRYFCEARYREGALHRVEEYSNIGRYMTPRRVFIGFIRPWTHGCGAVGHVWLVAQTDEDQQPDTLESYSGVGVASRSFDSGPLLRQVYSAYELPVQ